MYKEDCPNFKPSREANDIPLSKAEDDFYNKYINGINNDSNNKLKKSKQQSDREEQRDQLDLEKFKEIYKNLSIEDFQEYFKNDYNLNNLSVEELKKRGMESISDMIDYDKKRVIEERKKENASDKTERSIILEELIFGELLGIVGLFGKDYCPRKTTEYDDRINGTDGILEFALENGDYGNKLAVDCTVAENPDTLKEKFKKIKNEINNLSLTKIKYYEDENAEIGPFKMIPRVILSVTRDELKLLCEAYLEEDKTKFENHYIVLNILVGFKRQLEKQLEIISNNFVEEDMKESDIKLVNEMKDSISGVLVHIDKAIEEKENSLSDRNKQRVQDYFERSPLYKSILK